MREVQYGDIVEVKHAELNGILVKERWIRATVTDVDINKITVRYFETGRMEDVPRRQGRFR